MKKKILYLTPGCFDKGGISRYSRYQIAALRELFGDGQVRVLSLLGPTKDSFEIPMKVFWHSLSNALSDKIRFTLTALKQALLWKPDVIHVAHVNFSGLAVILAKLCGAVTVLNTYGLEVWSGFSKDALWGLKKVDWVISDCHYTANYLEQQNYRPHQSVKVFWDCVDLNRFTQGPVDLEVVNKYKVFSPDKYFVVMSLGRLIKSIALIANDYENLRLVIAGKGDNRSFLEAMAQAEGLGDKVVFTGAVDEDDLAGLYRTASVFSLVSDRGEGRGEGIPLTPLEAMACGVPVIVGNQDGSQEAVEEERNGKVVDPFDLQSHAEAIKELIENSELLRKKRKESKKVAREKFSYESFKSKHEKFYLEI